MSEVVSVWQQAGGMGGGIWGTLAGLLCVYVGTHDGRTTRECLRGL